MPPCCLSECQTEKFDVWFCLVYHERNFSFHKESWRMISSLGWGLGGHPKELVIILQPSLWNEKLRSWYPFTTQGKIKRQTSLSGIQKDNTVAFRGRLPWRVYLSFRSFPYAALNGSWSGRSRICEEVKRLGHEADLSSHSSTDDKSEWKCRLLFSYVVMVLFSVALRPNAGHGLFILQFSWSHTTTHHSQ